MSSILACGVVVGVTCSPACAGCPITRRPSSLAEMTATDIRKTTEAEPLAGEGEGLRASDVGSLVLNGKVAAIGTCHKCGGRLGRGRKEVASLCQMCGTRFHSVDCGNRLKISGYLGMSERCPKVRLAFNMRRYSTLFSRGTTLFSRGTTLFSRATRASEHTIPRRASPVEARTPHNRGPAQRARPPRPSAEPPAVPPLHKKTSHVEDAKFSQTHAPHTLFRVAVLWLVHVCRR